MSVVEGEIVMEEVRGGADVWHHPPAVPVKPRNFNQNHSRQISRRFSTAEGGSGEY